LPAAMKLVSGISAPKMAAYVLVHRRRIAVAAGRATLGGRP